MPRVNRDNRDLQRRLAARRARERRRPITESRYRLTPSEAVEPITDADAEAEVFDGAPEMVPQRDRARPSGKTAPAPARSRPRVSARPFSEYAAEYAYVYSDMRRIALVVGTLLVLLIILHFILPR